MNRYYRSVNECLDLWHGKNIPAVQKLLLDVQLCRLKRLLLEHDLDDATGETFMVSLRAVCGKMANLEGDEIPPADFEEVNRDLQRVSDIVTGWAAANRNGA